MAQGQHGRPADEFGADDHGAGAEVRRAGVDHRLQLAGRVDAGRTIAGNQPSSTRPLASSGRQHHGVSFHDAPPERRRDDQTTGPVPRGDHRFGLDPRSGVAGVRLQRAGVAGAGHEPVQVADAVTRMVAVPGDAAGLGLPFDHEDVTVDSRGERCRRGEPGRTTADDRDAHVLDVHRCSSRRAATVPPQ